MRKSIIISAAALAAAGAIAVPGVANAATVTTTDDIAVSVTGTPVDLPALNSQFTKMTLQVTGGNSTFGPNADMVTWYADGNFGANDQGYWDTTHGYGDLLAADAHPGAVVYSVDGGAWHKVTSGMTITKAQGQHVALAYNDIPGLYGDNTGPGYTVHMVRTKG